MEPEQSKAVINCPLCEVKELQIIKDNDGGMLQCLSCGYMTSDLYEGTKENNDAYQKLDPSLPGAPEVSELGFMEVSSENQDSEEDSLPNPAQWLAMLGDEGDEETE